MAPVEHFYWGHFFENKGMPRRLDPPMPVNHADHRSWQRDIPWDTVRHAWRHAHQEVQSTTNPKTKILIGPDPQSREGHTISMVTDHAEQGLVTVWRNEPGMSPQQLAEAEKAKTTASLKAKAQTNANREDQKAKQLQRAHESHPPHKTCKLCKK